jgi:hypothetical protein
MDPIRTLKLLVTVRTARFNTKLYKLFVVGWVFFPSLLLVIGVQYSYVNRLSLFSKNCVLCEVQTEILHKCRLKRLEQLINKHQDRERTWKTRVGMRDSRLPPRSTGRFIMFFMITDIYNNNNCSTATGKLNKFFFLTTRDIRCVHQRWHGTHRYDIQVLATHASTWVNMNTTYTRIALAAEMWTTMKNNLLGKTFLSRSFYLYGFLKYVSYGFPIINFCNPGVRYETPCIWELLSSGILRNV